MLKLVLLISLLTIGFTFAVSVKIIVLGDWGERLWVGQDWVAAAMAKWAEENNPEFIISTGDNIYPRGLRSPLDPQMDRKWRNVYHNYTSLADLPWYVSLGNHDYGEWEGEELNEIELSKYDSQWILPSHWYDFVEDFEGTSVHFVIIDTEAFHWQVERNNYTQMLTWMETTLSRSTADWKLVVGHRFAFSADKYGPATNSINNVLVPIMERNGVDAFLAGHAHNLQHIKNEDGTGMDHVISGAGGCPPSLYRPESAQALKEHYRVDVLFFRGTNGFVALGIDKDELEFDFYDYELNLVYEFTRTKQTKSD